MSYKARWTDKDGFAWSTETADAKAASEEARAQSLIWGLAFAEGPEFTERWTNGFLAAAVYPPAVHRSAATAGESAAPPG